MKKLILLISATLIIAAGCAKEDSGSVTPAPSHPEEGQVEFGALAVEDGVSVLIFKKQSSGFKYQETFSPVWNDKKATKKLQLGLYQFAFYKTDKLNATMKIMESTHGVNDFVFTAKPDAAKGVGFYKSVGDIWINYLSDINKTHTINGSVNHKVSTTLDRMVSGIDVIIKRGEKGMFGEFQEIPYPPGENIRDWIKSVTVELDNISTQLGAQGGLDDNAKFSDEFLLSKGASLPPYGNVKMTGPTFFPGKTLNNSNIKATIEPVDPAQFPSPLTATAKAVAMPNKKIELVLWLTQDPIRGQNIDIEVGYAPMGPDTGGDDGTWE